MPITEHTVKTERHTTFYLAAGPETGPLVIFVHGWPELSISWRNQLLALARLGFHAVASLCVPYYTLERGLDYMLTLVDRALYPESEFPAGQWDYMRYYEENFAEAIAPMDADVSEFLRVLFRKGDPAGEGKPAFTASARRSHSFFGMSALPDLPPDTDLLTGEDLSRYV